MNDLSRRFYEFEETFKKMSPKEFDEMLIRCGMERIKPSEESNCICCLKRTFSEKGKEYSVESAYKTEAYEGFNVFIIDDCGQEAA